MAVSKRGSPKWELHNGNGKIIQIQKFVDQDSVVIDDKTIAKEIRRRMEMRKNVFLNLSKVLRHRKYVELLCNR